MRVFITVYNKWPGCYTFLVILAIWEGVARVYPAVILPSPSETLQALLHIAGNGHIWEPLSQSFLRLAIGFGIAFIIGTGLGIVSGYHDNLYAFVRPAVTLLQSVPPVSWILLAILWLGVDGGAQILVVMIALFPVFFFNSVEGIQQVPKDLLEMASVFRVHRMKRIRDIYLPALRPYWLSALTINIGSGWKTVVMSELISGQTGIGAALNTSRLYLKTDEVIAWTLLVALLGMSLEWLMRTYVYGKHKERENNKRYAV
ncbi:ABC transporter permease [Paenibacillus sp. FSL H8-0034]|uniref:ABC transporter permease n=1 Tax=Paenibacillus sp. FSL H8-0034 TaxID=2954671 RepID=UPI0030F7DF39